MAQSWAKAFYNSKQWIEVRAYCLIRDKFLCQECKVATAEEVHHIIHLTEQNINDNNIALNPNNLRCLCKDCHFRQHEVDRLKGNNPNLDVDLLHTDYCFDEKGQLIRRT